MEVEIEEIDDAVRKVEDASTQKWKQLKEADTHRRIELKRKWKQRVEEWSCFEKKGENQYCCKIEKCKEEEILRNEEELFLHCYRAHGFWTNVEF